MDQFAADHKIEWKASLRIYVVRDKNSSTKGKTAMGDRETGARQCEKNGMRLFS